MIITGLKLSKRENVSIYADNEYLISVPVEIFSKSGFKKGDYIGEEDVCDLFEKKNSHKAKEKALRLLSYRAHSKKELENKVKRVSNEHFAKEAVDKMEKLGLINDFSFARSYAKDLFERKFYSIKRVKYELGAKGIDGDIIDKVISDLDPDEEAFLKQAFQKKYFGKIKSSKDFNRAVSYFQRLGYGWNLIKNVLNLFEIEYENN